MNQHIRILSTQCHELSKKNCLGETFLLKPASSLASLTRMSSGRFSNLSLCCCNNFPWAGTLIKGEFVEIDTAVGATVDADSVFTLAARFPVLDEE